MRSGRGCWACGAASGLRRGPGRCGARGARRRRVTETCRVRFSEPRCFIRHIRTCEKSHSDRSAHTPSLLMVNGQHARSGTAPVARITPIRGRSTDARCRAGPPPRLRQPCQVPFLAHALSPLRSHCACGATNSTPDDWLRPRRRSRSRAAAERLTPSDAHSPHTTPRTDAFTTHQNAKTDVCMRLYGLFDLSDDGDDGT